MKTKHFISLILALFLLLGVTVALFSCDKDHMGAEDFQGTETAAPADSSSGSTDTESPPEEETGPLTLIENGKSDYVVVYPNDASTVVLEAVDLLITKIEQKTGVTLKSKSDNLRGAAAHDPNEKAILVGRTNYEESQQVLDSLGRFEYKIAQVGNKMVINALNEVHVKTAITYYVSNLLTPNITGEEGAKTLVAGEYHYIPEDTVQNEFLINGTDITEFAIVYPKDDAEYKNVGKDLQSILLDKMGFELPIYSDAEAEREHEILLGKTSRAFSQSLYDDLQQYIMTYSFEVSGSKLQILSGGYYSAKQCIVDMPFFVLAGEDVKLTDGTHYKTEILSNPTELTEGADVRIMTANLGIPPGSEKYLGQQYRVELFAGILRDYQPDAVGLQELDDSWAVQLEHWLGILRDEYGLEYTLHNEVNAANNNRTNPISLLFRSDLYRCVEEDTHMYPHWSPGQGISITMCHLQSKTDSTKEFLLMDTHWDVDLWEGAQKDTCSEEATAFVNEWKSADCPIFFTGDWNAKRGRDCLEDFIEATDAQTADTGQYCIEWTFYWGEGVTAKDNKCLTQYSAVGDHPQRYTDFDLW